MRAGDTFLMHLTDSGAGPYYHLFVVLTDPDPENGRVVAVMLMTATKNTDGTVILQIGDHPFIKHPTAVHFSTAKYYQAAKIEQAFAKGICRQRDRIADEVLTKIRAGLLASPYTVNAIRAYCRTKF